MHYYLFACIFVSLFFIPTYSFVCSCVCIQLFIHSFVNIPFFSLTHHVFTHLSTIFSAFFRPLFLFDLSLLFSFLSFVFSTFHLSSISLSSLFIYFLSTFLSFLFFCIVFFLLFTHTHFSFSSFFLLLPLFLIPFPFFSSSEVTPSLTPTPTRQATPSRPYNKSPQGNNNKPQSGH